MTRTADTLKRIALLLAFGTALGTGPVQAQAPTSPSRQPDDRTAASRQAEDRSTSPKLAPTKSDPPPPAASQRQAEPRRQAEPQRQPDPQHQAQSNHRDSSRGDANRGQDPSPAWRPLGPAWQPIGPAWQPLAPVWQSDTRPTVVPRPGEDRFRAGADTYAPDGRRDRDHRRSNGNVYLGYPYVVPYGFAPYFPSAVPDASTTTPAAAPDAHNEPVGYLRLRVEPRNAEVYVDGAYAGIVDEFGGTTQRLLPAGPHRVEIVAQGYAGITVDVRIPENDTITFARDLEHVTAGAAPPPPSAPVIPHKPMYIVPRCYVGDTPPRASDLPAGCTLNDLRVIP